MAQRVMDGAFGGIMSDGLMGRETDNLWMYVRIGIILFWVLVLLGTSCTDPLSCDNSDELIHHRILPFLPWSMGAQNME